MHEPRLEDQGDWREKRDWSVLQPLFPLYEEFWRKHVFPLRARDNRISPSVDGCLELMAQDHYKCFVSLAFVLKGLEDEHHPERAFSSLQNAGNRARDVVSRYNCLWARCIPENRSPICVDRLKKFGGRIAQYRNYVHEDLIGMAEWGGRLFVPVPEKLKHYKRWSRMRTAKPEDFVEVSTVLSSYLRELCGLLDVHWRAMLDRSDDLRDSGAYRSLLPATEPPPTQTPIALSSGVEPVKLPDWHTMHSPEGGKDEPPTIATQTKSENAKEGAGAPSSKVAVTDSAIRD